jgi:D-tyrosyl-tRNA(Tyr) deacylase
VQRVSSALVRVDDQVKGEIGEGLCVLLGVGPGDSVADAERLALKIAQMRIFPDEQGRFNRSLLDTGGQCLVVSQFTLFGDTTRGRRPSFVAAAPAELARALYEEFRLQVSGLGIRTAAGVFGASMDVELVNRGPVTMVVSTDSWNTAIT